MFVKSDKQHLYYGLKSNKSFLHYSFTQTDNLFIYLTSCFGTLFIKISNLTCLTQQNYSNQYVINNCVNYCHKLSRASQRYLLPPIEVSIYISRIFYVNTKFLIFRSKFLICKQDWKNRTKDRNCYYNAFIGIFHQILEASSKFIDTLCRLVLLTERGLNIEPSFLYKATLIRFFLRHPDDTLDLFLSDQNIIDQLRNLIT